MKPAISVNIGKRAVLTMSKRKTDLVGIIAEDDSDVESIKILIHRIADNDTIGIKKFVGRGCGKIISKSKAWVKILRDQGCTVLILVHDLDKNKLDVLKAKLESCINPCPFEKYLICIPVLELESWLLSDTVAIKTALNLKKLPKIEGNTFDIADPKEFLERIIASNSNNEKRYLNTVHNKLISKELSIEKAKEKNPSFVPFYNFVKNNL
jgi:hypothetical protein